MEEISYVSDWSAVGLSRHQEAQEEEKNYWRQQDPIRLTLHAQHYYYAGYYEWDVHKALLNPFGVKPSNPKNFQIPVRKIWGRTVLDVGCGPTPATLSLVHCAAEVHAVDPLLDFYRRIQPFGWNYFKTVSAVGAERLPFSDESFDCVYCWNVLDHSEDADQILREIVRVLVPKGQFLFGCDARGERGGGHAHPYKWTIEALESRIFSDFKPIIPVTLIDDHRNLARHENVNSSTTLRWVCRLQKRKLGSRKLSSQSPNATLQRLKRFFRW